MSTTLEPTVQEKTIEQLIATELSVTSRQVWSAIKLLDSGATVPFIARYRKEVTGGLSDTHLRMLADRLEYLRELEKRRADILASIASQGKLTESLKNSIEKATTKSVLEDLYLPFRPKKNSKAQAARDMGLEPLAEALLKEPTLDPMTEAQKYVNADKAVTDAIAALAGAREILMERFTEEPTLIGALREKFWTEGWLVSKKKETKTPVEGAEKFSDYFTFRQLMKDMPSHRVLAILRGRNEGVLDIEFLTDAASEYSTDKKDMDAEYLYAIMHRFGIESRRRAADPWLSETVRYAWKYKIRLRLEIDLVTRMRERAEEEAIRVFAENLKSLLLAAPAGPRVTMGLDPGFRTGVKVAIVDKTSKVVQTGVIYPHEPKSDWDLSIRAMVAACKKYAVEVIAIGNGTASRETDKLVADMIRQYPDLKLQKIVVSEAGASVYSASEIASKEHPDLDVSLRGALSIARRLQDPLAELVKIDPKSIGVGQYQHDVNQGRLGKMLNEVVEDCVNAVGVDANTASVSLLSYVSGLTKTTAENIVKYRGEKGSFKNRQEFTKIPAFGPKTFEQAAGFLRIRGGDNPLDMSAVHPEAYPVVEKIIELTKKDLTEIMGSREVLSKIEVARLVNDKFGEPTVKDILAELEKPGRDPRPEFKAAALREDVTRMEDLKPGMMLEGTVTNVAAFGAFVDIGVHQDGLVHISELSDRFVQDPQTVVKTGQIVKVKVVSIDLPRKRIALSMRSSSTPVAAASTNKPRASSQFNGLKI